MTESSQANRKLTANEIDSLKLVKHGVPLDDEMRQRLVDAQCIAREMRGWALTTRGKVLDALG